MKKSALSVLIAVTTVVILFAAGGAAQTDVADPSGPGTTSVHNWTIENVTDYGNSTQELDAITVDYPSGFSFDGLTQANATVIMTRTLSSGKDTSEISLNDRTYSGSSAVLELSGFSQTDVAGPIEITIDGIENPSSEGEYNVSFILDGDNGTKTVERSLNITGQPNIGVDIQSTNSPVGAGENLTVTAAIDNSGTTQGTQTVTLDSGALGATSQNVTLAPGAVETRMFNISTSSGDTGQFTATVSTEDDNDSQPIVIGQPNFGVTIQNTNAPIGVGENLTVTAAINNSGAIQGTQTVAVDSGALGATSQNVTLAPGTVGTRTFNISTSPGDTGQFTATVSTEDDSDSQPIEVLVNRPDFQLSITNRNTPIRPGDTLTVDLTVENAGAVDSTQVIKLENSGAVRASVGVSLAGGASTTETLTWDTSGDAVGAVSTISTDNDSQTLVTTEDAWGAVNTQDTGSRGPVAISPDGSLVAHANGSNVAVYDSQTEARVQVISVASNGISSLDWHPDGDRLAFGTVGNTLQVYDVSAQTPLDTLSYSGTVEDVEWSPAGDKLLAAAGSTAYVLDAASRGQLRTETDNGGLGAVAWSGDAQRFALGGSRAQVFKVGGGQILNVDVKNGADSGRFDGFVRGMAFARDGTRLVSIQQSVGSTFGGTARTAGRVSLFNVGTGAELDKEFTNVEFGGSGSKFADVAADPTDDRVVLVSSILPTRVYTIGTGNLTETESFGGRAGSADWAHSGRYIADSADASNEGTTWRVHTSRPVVDGTVTDTSGNPVGNVSIELAQGTSRVDGMVTDSNGAFTLIAPEDGAYNLTAVKTTGNEQIFESKQISVPESGTTVPFTTTLIGTGLSGRVVDAQGDPIPSATVTHNKTASTVTTNTQGRFVFDTQAGGFAVSADAPAFRSDTAAVSVQAGQVTGPVVLQLPAGVSGLPITGQVVDPQGNPVEGADLFAGSNQAATNAQGDYIIGVGQPGQVVVTAVTAIDSKTRTVTVTAPNGTDGVDFVLQQASGPPGGGQPGQGDPPVIESVNQSKTIVAIRGSITLNATVSHGNFSTPGSETVAVAFKRYRTGDPATDPTLGNATLTQNGTVSITHQVGIGPRFRWYVVAQDAGGATAVSGVQTADVTGAGAVTPPGVAPNPRQLLDGDSWLDSLLLPFVALLGETLFATVLGGGLITAFWVYSGNVAYPAILTLLLGGVMLTLTAGAVAQAAQALIVIGLASTLLALARRYVL